MGYTEHLPAVSIAAAALESAYRADRREGQAYGGEATSRAYEA